MITLSPLTATVAKGGSTMQFTCSSDNHVEWTVFAAGNLTGSSINQSGLFTSGPNAGTAIIGAKRFHGSYQTATVTVT